jgi:hypothetical protein
MPFDPNQFDNDEDPSALVVALIVLGILAAIILAVLVSDEHRESVRRAFEPIPIAGAR